MCNCDVKCDWSFLGHEHEHSYEYDIDLCEFEELVSEYCYDLCKECGD